MHSKEDESVTGRKTAMEQGGADVVARLGAAIEEWQARIAETHQRLAEQLSAARGQMDTLASAETPASEPGEDLQAAIAELEDALAERDGSIAALSAEAAALTGRAEAAEAALRDAQQRAAALEMDAAGLDAARSAMEALRRELEDAKGDAARAREESDRLQAALNEANALARQRAEDVQAELEQARFDAAQAREEAQRLRDQNAALESNLRKATPAGPLKIEAFDARGHKKRMGEILVELGVISQEQLQELLAEQQAAPQRRLGKLVVDRGHTNELVIARILASQLRLPFIELREGDISPDAPELLSAHLVRLHRCVPVRREEDSIVLAMANPMDLIAIEDVEHATGCRVEPVVATAAAIELAITRLWGKA